MLFTGYSRRTLLAFFLALLVHLMLLAILIVSLGWSSKSQPTKQEATPVVQATVVDEDKLLAEAEQQQQVKQETLEAEPDLAQIQRRQQAAAEQTRQEAERQRELEQQQQQEQERLKQLEAERQAKEEVRRKAEAEKKRIEEEKRRLEEGRRRAEAERKRAEEERRRAEAERRHLEEERRRAEAAAKRKAEEERRQQELQARIRAEQNAAQERQIKADIGRFITQVELRVKRHWIRPPSTRGNVAVLLQVEMLPSGEVRNVEVIQSSGDRALDRSAQAAVYKAAPLPLPPDPAAAARLLPRFNFRFIPGN